MNKRRLLTGVAYHGNRMPSHVRTDMEEIARADMDIVVHMMSHTDWKRHKNIMKENIRITEEFGMDVWVDNWGIGGAPGDTSHFLAYHPEAHMMFSNGEMHPTQVCLNSPAFRQFTHEWLDMVAEIGGKTIFWDEPHIPTKRVTPENSDPRYYCCCCDTCKRMFEEKYGHSMPELLDEEANKFRTDSIVDYFADVTEYAAKLGMKNAGCVMLGAYHGINLESLHRLCSLPHFDNLGSDPYWHGSIDKMPDGPYQFVYEKTKQSIENSDKYGKDHNIWIQTYNNPRGREEDIIQAAEAAYDAGARTIIAWGYYGSISNDYGALNAPVVWHKTCEAMQRIRNFERDRILAENRRLYMK